jgi:hypothetical protein
LHFTAAEAEITNWPQDGLPKPGNTCSDITKRSLTHGCQSSAHPSLATDVILHYFNIIRQTQNEPLAQLCAYPSNSTKQFKTSLRKHLQIGPSKGPPTVILNSTNKHSTREWTYRLAGIIWLPHVNQQDACLKAPYTNTASTLSFCSSKGHVGNDFKV